jgi:hypothetical protein
MAGTTTVAREDLGRGIEKITFSWLSDASGDADAGVAAVYGHIRRVVTNPGAAAPTDNYDIILNDADGVDVLAAGLGNRDTANSEQIFPDLGTAVAGDLTLVVSSAGNAKNGTVVLYVD